MQAKKCEQQCLVTGDAVNDEDLSAISAIGEQEANSEIS